MMKKKVFGIEVPPRAEGNELSCLPKELWSKVSPQLCGFSSKGDYLSWDEFITRTPQFKGYKEATWHLLKLKRNLEVIDKLFAYKSDGKVALVFYSISSLVHKIHKIGGEDAPACLARPVDRSGWFQEKTKKLRNQQIAKKCRKNPKNSTKDQTF